MQFRLIPRICVSVLIVLSLIGVGTTAISAEPEVVTLHYFNWAGSGGTLIQEDWIEPFEKEHPHIRIELESGSWAQFWDKLTIYYATGNAPDIMHMSVGYLNEYAEQGLLENLQPYFDRDLDPDDFFVEGMKAVRYPSTETGDLYAIPFSSVMMTMFYNKTIFDESGLHYPDSNWTWYDVRNIGKKLTRDTNNDGETDQWGFWTGYSYEFLEPTIHSWGGAVLDEDYSVKVTEVEAVEATQFLVDLIWKDRIAPPVNLEANKVALFQRGDLAILNASIYELHEFRGRVGFEWDVAHMPIGPERRVVRMWPDSFAISNQSEHKEEAWEFIKYVITRMEIDRYNGSRKLPLYKPLAMSEDWLETNLPPDKRVFIESIPFAEPLEFRPNWAEWNGARGRYLRPAWNGEIPVEEALQGWAKAIESSIGR